MGPFHVLSGNAFMKRLSVFGLVLFSFFAYAQKKWTLQESVSYALENNLQILQSSYNTDFQRLNLDIAKRQYLPSVSGNVNNVAAFGQARDIFGNSNRNDNFSNSANVSANILLFNHGNLEKSIRKTEYDVRASDFDSEQIKDDISLQIAQQYLSILLNREILKIAQSTLQNAEKLYERAKITTEVGTTAQTVLAEAEAARAREKQNVKTAEINVERGLFTLAMLLQLPDYKNFDIVDVPVENSLQPPLYNSAEVLAKAFDNQPQIHAAENRVNSAEAQTEITKTAFWPTVSANAGLGTSYFSLFSPGYDINGNRIRQSGFFKQYKDNFGQQVGVTANIPIFNKGITKIQVEQSKINEAVARNSLAQQKQIVQQNVQKAQFDAESNYETFVAAEQAAKSSALALDFSEKSFAAGRSTVYELNSARNNYANALGTAAQAKYNYLFSLKLLNFYAGIPLTL